ncbi:MAG: universal stress protein [Candidatus Binatia bacterium]
MTRKQTSEMAWTRQARERLSRVPEGFMRELTRWRVEELAGARSLTIVSEEIFDEKIAGWATASAVVQRTLPWDPDALSRTTRIPPAVRGMVVLEVERHARRCGERRVKISTLEGAMAMWAKDGRFHSDSKPHAPSSETQGATAPPPRYRHIYVAVDNSPASSRAIELAVSLARAAGGHLTGCHVYAAGLHENRFQQMERGLPQRYQQEQKLRRQRSVHDSLIRRGLKLIADSYLDVFQKQCEDAGVPFERHALEGKNYAALLDDIERSGCDLVVLGRDGLGTTGDGELGSVCERILRRTDSHVLIVKDIGAHAGPITVAIDGSDLAFSALGAALDLRDATGAAVEAVAAYDPHFHTVAFRSIAEVLSEEAGRLFHFKEQEQLHEEVIDRGLARVYRNHLETAEIMARERGVELPVCLLSGKAFAAVLSHIEARRTWLLALGRTGAHAVGDGEVGATCLNLARRAPCHVLVVGEKPRTAAATSRVCEETWRPAVRYSHEAAARLERVPQGFMRDAARRAALAIAECRREPVITAEIVEEAIAESRREMPKFVLQRIGESEASI